MSDTDKDVKDIQKLGNHIHSLPDEVLEKMQADGMLFLPENKDEEQISHCCSAPVYNPADDEYAMCEDCKDMALVLIPNVSGDGYVTLKGGNDAN